MAVEMEMEESIMHMVEVTAKGLEEVMQTW